jgi:hypothetical protein
MDEAQPHLEARNSPNGNPSTVLACRGRLLRYQPKNVFSQASALHRWWDNTRIKHKSGQNLRLRPEIEMASRDPSARNEAWAPVPLLYPSPGKHSFCQDCFAASSKTFRIHLD